MHNELETEGIQLPISRGTVEPSIDHDRRAIRFSTSSVAPQYCAIGCVHSVNFRVERGKVDNTISYSRRTCYDPACRCFIEHISCVSVKSVQIMIVRSNVEHAICCHRRRGDITTTLWSKRR